MKIQIILALMVIACTRVAAQKTQEPNTKFGKISPEDLSPKVYAIDSSAPAVVLYDVGQTQITGNHKGSLSMEHKHHKRIHVLNKNGYDYADVVIHLYKNGSDETVLQNLKAVTYNLENGKVVETKLEKTGIFREQVDKHRTRVKFTFPAVKEGSIIEYDYTLVSDFYFSLMPWEFQGNIPRLWSEYRFSLPQFMNYLFFAQGYFPFHIKENKDRRSTFTFSNSGVEMRTETSSFTCNVTDYRWVMKDVTVLKQEQFTSTLDNHIAKIEFQLSGYQDPLTPKQIMNDWPKTAQSLLERDDFGKLYMAGNNWLDGEVKQAVAGAITPEQKARNIYAYVRDHFTCTSHSSLIPDQSLRTTVKNHKGTVSEINLLLIAMLRAAGLKAEPVVLSTRDNGYANAYYPLVNRLNYVVCKIELERGPVFLDASYSQLGFGKMMYHCYNGSARIINEMAPAVDFISDSLVEQKTTFVNLANVSGKWLGTVRQMPGYYESYQIRDKVSVGGKEAVKKEIEQIFSNLAIISSLNVDSLKVYEKPVQVVYELEMQNNGEDILYVNPLMGKTIGENPFKSAERFYPVEMPYTLNETYVVNIEVPEGYVLDEAPKPVRMIMNEEGDAKFDYLITVSGKIISMRVQMIMNRAYFAAEEYDMLREFYSHVLSKQSEQLVFKKKK